MASLPSIEVLNDLLECDFNKGELRWKERHESYFLNEDPGSAKRWNATFAGKLAFNISRGYYNYGHIFGEPHQRCKVIFKMKYNIEAEVIYHINGNCKDDRLSNLTLKKEEVKEFHNRFHGKYGKIGVSWDKKCKKWHSTITLVELLSLGHFEEWEEAVAVREKAEMYKAEILAEMKGIEK